MTTYTYTLVPALNTTRVCFTAGCLARTAHVRYFRSFTRAALPSVQGSNSSAVPTPMTVAFSLGSMLICLYMPRYVHFCLCLAVDRSRSCSMLMLVPKIVHRLAVRGSYIQDLACHPTLPILGTIFSSYWILCLWDARTQDLY